MQFKDFLKAMEKVCKFYDRELNEEQLKIWFERVKPLRINHFKGAIDHHIDTGRFFPTPGELFEFARDLAIADQQRIDTKELRTTPQERSEEEQGAKVNFKKIVNLLDHKKVRAE